MDFDDLKEPEQPFEKPQPIDGTGYLISANGFLVLAFGVLLLMTPVGDRQNVEAPDFGLLEALGISALGVFLMVCAYWRRDRRIFAVPVTAAALLGSVAVLAVVNAGLMAICPTIGLLALINRPFPRVVES